MKMAANPADARNQLANRALSVPLGTPPNHRKVRKPRFHHSLVAPEQHIQQSPGPCWPKRAELQRQLPLSALWPSRDTSSQRLLTHPGLVSRNPSMQLSISSLNEPIVAQPSTLSQGLKAGVEPCRLPSLSGWSRISLHCGGFHFQVHESGDFLGSKLCCSKAKAPSRFNTLERFRPWDRPFRARPNQMRGRLMTGASQLANAWWNRAPGHLAPDITRHVSRPLCGP
jgi:hypothetical protein